MEKIRLLNLIEQMEGATTAHLHALFFSKIRPERAWNPATQRGEPATKIGTRLESARRRIGAIERRGEVEFFRYIRPGCSGVAVYLTPLAYTVYGSRLSRRIAVVPSSAAARRGWQRGEIWTAFEELGATYHPGGLHGSPCKEPAPYDVVIHGDRRAFVLIDSPTMTCEQLAVSLPKAKDHKQPVMVVPSHDGSVWDAQADTWAWQGSRFRELLYMLEQRGDCVSWEPKRLAGAGALAVQKMKPAKKPPPSHAMVLQTSST